MTPPGPVAIVLLVSHDRDDGLGRDTAMLRCRRLRVAVQKKLHPRQPHALAVSAIASGPRPLVRRRHPGEDLMARIKLPIQGQQVLFDDLAHPRRSLSQRP